MNKVLKLTFAAAAAAMIFTVSAFAADGISAKVTGSSVNLRSQPSLEASVLLQAAENEEITVLSTDNSEWYQVVCQGSTGYMSSEYIQLSDAVFVTGSVVNLRATPSLDGEIIAKVTAGKQLKLLESGAEWSKVQGETLTGYIASEYLSTEKPKASSKAAEVIAFAKKYLGTKYVYGGSSPKGFDCSGFTSYVFKNFDISLSRSSKAQYANTTHVKRSELQPGDLLFFRSPGSKSIGHVGIYIGDNQMIHASSPGDVVKIDTIASGYYNTYYVGASRVL